MFEVSEAVVQRSCHPEVFCTKGVLKISQNSQESTCARVCFSIKFIKKETLAQVFSYVFCKISKGALNKFLTSIKKPVFKYYLHINGYLHCTNPFLFFNFHVKWLIPLALVRPLNWKYKDLMKIVWRHKVQKMK